MKHLMSFLIWFLICFILVVIASEVVWPHAETFSLQEALKRPLVPIISLVLALFFTILYRDGPY
jgi:membrane protein DedA with SNARE-associated domain